MTRPPDGLAWDLLVVGGGTAGLVAAQTAAALGASVLMGEGHRTGGDCLWTGCVPSKALLSAAHAAADARAADRYGVRASVDVDFDRVMRHVRAAIAAIEPDDAPDTLEAAGVRVALEDVRLTGPGSALVGHDAVAFRQALVATGSSPVLPPVPGLADAGPLTSETIWDIADLPDRMLVLGGGSIGCELAQAFQRLGSAVTIVESAPRLLTREDPDAARVVTDALVADGITVRTGAEVTAVTDADGVRRASLGDGTAVAFDAVLVAAGRRPRTAGLGLADAGVALDDRGYVAVDGRLRTTNPRIWAAGDVTGHPQFTHTAGVNGALAASNAILGLRRSVDPVVPRVTFTQPEVAAVGVLPDAPGVTTRTVRHDAVDRARAEDQQRGFTRLVLDAKGRIVGATIVGPRAGESLAEVVLALRQGLRARDLAAVTHAYPTYADGVWKGAIAEVQAALGRGAVRRVSRGLADVRRRWVSR